MPEGKFLYEVAISLAGAHVPEAQSLKAELVSSFNIKEDAIYLYTDQGIENIGKKIKPELRKIYLKKSRLVVVLLSTDYLKNELTNTEWETIKSRLSYEDDFLISIRMEEEVMTKDQDELEGFYDEPWSLGVMEIARIISERLASKKENRTSKKSNKKRKGEVTISTAAEKIKNQIIVKGDFKGNIN